MPLALPAVTVPFLPNAGFSLRQALHRRLRTAMVVFGEHLARRLAVAIAQRHRRQLFLQASGLVGGVGALLRAQRELVLHLARDALLLGIELGGVGHVQAAIAVEQRHHERVFQLAFAQADAPAHAANHVRRLRHRFHAAGQHDLRLAELNHLRGGDDRLHARAAQAIDGERRNLDGNAGLQRDVARAVDGVARSLLRVADDDVIDFAGLDAGALHGFRGGDGAQFHGGEVAQLAAVAAHGRAGAVDDCDI